MIFSHTKKSSFLYKYAKGHKSERDVHPKSRFLADFNRGSLSHQPEFSYNKKHQNSVLTAKPFLQQSVTLDRFRLLPATSGRGGGYARAAMRATVNRAASSLLLLEHGERKHAASHGQGTSFSIAISSCLSETTYSEYDKFSINRGVKGWGGAAAQIRPLAKTKTHYIL